MSAGSSFPNVDASKQDRITDEQAQFFRENGLLVIRNVLRGEVVDAGEELLVERAHIAENSRSGAVGIRIPRGQVGNRLVGVDLRPIRVVGRRRAMSRARDLVRWSTRHAHRPAHRLAGTEGLPSWLAMSSYWNCAVRSAFPSRSSRLIASLE